MRLEFLENYEAAIAVHSQLFSGVKELLSGLKELNVAWGIVTNKAERFTNPLIPQIELANAACVISGDTTPHAKPHPEPLFEAARRIQVSPSDCWYIGDDLRLDVQGAQQVGMTTAWVNRRGLLLADAGHADVKPDLIVENLQELLRELL